MTGTETMQTLRGRGNKRGCAIGKTEYMSREEHVAHPPAGEPRRERARLDEALKASREELLSLYRALVLDVGEGEAWVFLMQIYLLDSSFFSGDTCFYISEGKSAEEALFLSFERFLRENTHASYLRDVSEDMRDVIRRITSHLSKEREKRPLSENFILLSPSPTCSQIYELYDSLIGVVAKGEWENTNASALARALFIPAVFTSNDFDEAVAHKNAIIDSSHGAIYLDPDLNTLESFAKAPAKNMTFTQKASKKRTLPLLAKTSSLLEASRIHESDFDGIGLFHSEELYLRSVSPPDEETLFETYRSLAESLFPRPLVLRSFAVSALGGVRINKITSEDKNEPELYVFHDETLARQIKAALRASVFGSVSLAVPCGCTYDSLKKVNELEKRASEELRLEKREYREVAMGAVLDSPAAAIMCDKILDNCNFLILKYESIKSRDSSGEIKNDAERYLLERVAKTAKRKKKPALLCLPEKLDANELPLIKKLGFSALIISPDNTEYFM